MITSNPRPTGQQRRSQRILRSVSVLVSGQQAHGSPFSERTKTLVVNAHGALIQLREPVLAGQQLRIKNLATNEEVRVRLWILAADRATFRNWELPSRNRH